MISHLYDLSTPSNNYSSISIITSIPTHLITTFSTSISILIAHLIYSSTITLIIPIHLAQYLNYASLIISSISTHLVEHSIAIMLQYMHSFIPEQMLIVI